jgi:hypothetical protein
MNAVAPLTSKSPLFEDAHMTGSELQGAFALPLWLSGFCASSSAKAVMVGWSHAAWRSWIFLCSLRSFILR